MYYYTILSLFHHSFISACHFQTKTGPEKIQYQKEMHVHCLSVLMLVLTAQTLNICSLFYLNVNIHFFFHLCYQIMFPLVENTGFSLQSLYLVSHQSSLFRKGALYYIFIQDFVALSSHCSLNFHPPKPSCSHFQSSSLSQRQISLPACRISKHSHNRSGWREISHRTQNLYHCSKETILVFLLLQDP